ncbi:DUF4241 domain-containing protein [Bariatricus sp. SGI.154]|uniref:DUF4241 domain-containing protein n=1 Tax=Bariatricus sp. SGI.154 TaxID=3420549 RepID=UPI003D074506
MNMQQRKAAEQSMIEWLSHPNELGKVPVKIECTKEFDLHGLHYYVFRFKAKRLGEWMLAVCGGYEGDELEHCGHIYSNMGKYNDKTSIEDATAMVEAIRTYWIERAREQEDFQTKFRMNTDFRTQEEISAEEIESQFIKSESRYFLTVGEIDCPTGQIVVADPLAYLPSVKFSPVLAESIPVGKYPVEVSICRQNDIGIRMCTAKLKITDAKAVKYKKTASTDSTGIKFKDGVMEGFPVDAGMMAFCDVKVAEEYRAFLDKWHESNPEGNHYDDYFAVYFAESYKALPAYQREGGDFIEWANPDTGNKMVMVASGFGDGFYNSYYGYDLDGQLCQIIVPMVNPSIFIE